MSSSPNSSSSSELGSPYDWLLDVPCPVDVVLGTSTISVGECARLGVNSVIRLRQPAGSDLDVRLAGRAFASAEVAIAEDSVSLRLNRILPPGPQDAGV